MSIEQEPEAWMWEEEFCDEWTTVSSIIKPKSDKQRKNIQPLYTAPKRTSLELEIADCCGSEDYREGFRDGALYAEKAHGIGGGE